jgi:RNA polymerase sigma-70 factor (ECF subfamily)
LSGSEPTVGHDQIVAATGDDLNDLIDNLAGQAADRSQPALEALLFAIDHHRLADPGIRRVVMEEHAVEDIRQDVLIAVSESLPSWSRTGRFRSWLFSVGRNKAIAHVRRRKPTPDEEGVARRGETERISSIVAEEIDIDGLLSRLPPTYREAVRLRDREGRSYAEVAEALDLPLNTTRSRICRGRALLAQQLADDAEDN